MKSTPTDRIYSDAAGLGAVASYSFPNSDRKKPTLTAGCEEAKLRRQVKDARSTFPSLPLGELPCTSRQQLVGRQVVLFIDNEAMCAAWAKGAANNEFAFLSTFRYSMAFEVDRAPSNIKPADASSR